MAVNVELVFVTEGVPEYTFVPPPNYSEILLDIRRAGKPVIIEGQSGTGKTTCVKKILEKLGGTIKVTDLTARKKSDVSIIEDLAQNPVAGIFIIDDFHRLTRDLQDRLANIAKNAAESGDLNLPKLVLIGINEVGSELIQMVPDIAKRTGIHKINPGTEADILQLIGLGCDRLNIEINDVNIIYQESRGDFWLTQQLCQTICTLNNVTESSSERRTVTYDLASLRNRVVDKLRSAYYHVVKEFSRGRRFRPSNDPYFKLLRAVASQDYSVVDLSALANSNPEVRGSINNVKDHRLEVLLNSNPHFSKHFYYNSVTKTFALEDPALFYFLKHLDWERLRIDCGFRQGRDYTYDFALSFAGENRDLAAMLTDALQLLDASVFYDTNYESNFLGRAWGAEFKRVFSEECRLIVCFLDTHHAEKIWPTFERECFLPRVSEASVIPIFLDDSIFVGIPQDIIGHKFRSDRSDIQACKNEIEDLAFKLIERIS